MVFQPGTWVRLSTLVAAAALSLSAQAGGTHVKVYSFPSPSDTSTTSPGSWPAWDLSLESSSGLLYGVTPVGGAAGGGALYTVQTGGSVTTLRSFGTAGDAAGSAPNGPVLPLGGAIYGVTRVGGVNGKGVLFKWSATSGYQVQYHFGAGTGGATPSGPLLLASNGNVYGTTTSGGDCGQGTVFQFPSSNPASVTVTHSFCGQEGSGPMTGVIQAYDGKLYGTAYDGGDYSGGTLFSVDPATNAFSRLVAFGSTPTAPRYPSRLVQGRDGLLYGTSYRGGYNIGLASQPGTIFSSTLTGSVTATGLMFTDMQNPSPWAALNERFTGIFYSTSAGSDGGKLYQFRASNSTVSIIHAFSSSTGNWPKAGLTVGADGNLWGVTTDGESTGWGVYGTIFKIQLLTANP